MKFYVILAAIFLAGVGFMTLLTLFRPISPDKAVRNIGKRKRVMMIVERTFKKDNGDVILYPKEAADFFVEIPSIALSKLPKNPELHFRQQRVVVSGKIEQEDTRFKIVLLSREQISILKE